MTASNPLATLAALVRLGIDLFRLTSRFSCQAQKAAYEAKALSIRFGVKGTTMSKVYSNPRMSATIEDWPSGSKRVTAVFTIEQHAKRGERAVRMTTGAPKTRQSPCLRRPAMRQSLERKLPQMMPPLSGGPRPETPKERNARRKALLRHSDFIADYIMERLDYPSKVDRY